MPELIVQTISGVIVGLVIGFAGGFLGLRQLQKERGFDRRLHWCEGALGAFHQAGAAVLSAMTEDGRDFAEDCWNEVIRCYEALIPICGQAWLYASPEAAASISKFMKSLQGLIENHLESHERTVVVEACTQCLDDLKEAGIELSKIARAHLGFGSVEELTGEPFRTRSIFIRSFRGRMLATHGQAFGKRSGHAEYSANV